jgi:hypothetical protein
MSCDHHRTFVKSFAEQQEKRIQDVKAVRNGVASKIMIIPCSMQHAGQPVDWAIHTIDDVLLLEI